MSEQSSKSDNYLLFDQGFSEHNVLIPPYCTNLLPIDATAWRHATVCNSMSCLGRPRQRNSLNDEYSSSCQQWKV